MILMKIKR